MRVNRGMIQCCRHALLKLFADYVLKDVCLLVHFIPLEAKGLDEVKLHKPVVANDFQGYLCSTFGEGDALVLLIVDEV